MFQTRPHRPAPLPGTDRGPSIVALAADLEVIARIEQSLGTASRATSRRSRADFSRLARHIPDLKI